MCIRDREECAKNIGSIGYYAQQKVLENQMDGNDYYTLLQIVEAESTGGAVSYTHLKEEKKYKYSKDAMRDMRHSLQLILSLIHI